MVVHVDYNSVNNNFLYLLYNSVKNKISIKYYKLYLKIKVFKIIKLL